MTPTREQLAVELLKRIYDWNMLDSAADGSFWRREIAQVVAPIQPPTEGDLKWAAAACLAAPPQEAAPTNTRHGYGCADDGDEMTLGVNCTHCCRHGWVERVHGRPCPKCYPVAAPCGPACTDPYGSDEHCRCAPPAPAPMPPIEPGDWLEFHEDVGYPVAVEDCNIEMFRDDADDIIQMRKEDGRVWRREPRS